MTKPSLRQIVFNWLMDEPDFATKTDGYWGGSDEVAKIDALLLALKQPDKPETASVLHHCIDCGREIVMPILGRCLECHGKVSPNTASGTGAIR